MDTGICPGLIRDADEPLSSVLKAIDARYCRME